MEKTVQREANNVQSDLASKLDRFHDTARQSV